MEEIVETPKKHKGWPLGKPRKPRAVPAFLPAPEPQRGIPRSFAAESAQDAPIHVRLRLKNYAETIEFGCAEHTVENGFHVFMYPSERDRYRTTRREFAISEIIEIEITAARRQVEIQIPPQYDFPAPQAPPEPVRGPVVHSVRKHAAGVLAALEQSSGPIKMDAPPGISFGGHDG